MQGNIQTTLGKLTRLKERIPLHRPLPSELASLLRIMKSKNYNVILKSLKHMITQKSSM